MDEIQNDRFSFEKGKKVEISFILSIILYIIGIMLLTTIILRIPNIDRYFTESQLNNYDGDNFFFKWHYTYHYSYSDYIYTLSYIQPSYGFFTFLPIISVLFVLTGCGFFIRNPMHKKILFYTTWILNLSPVIAYIIISSIIKAEHAFLSHNTEYYIPTLGLYPIYSILPLQLILIFSKETFLDFIGFGKDENNDENKKSMKKRLPLVVTVLISLIVSIMFPYLLFSERLLDTENFWIFLIIVSIMNFYLIILIFTFKRKQFIKRYIKELFAFFLPVISCIAFSFLMIFFIPWYYAIQEFFIDLLQSISFPFVLQALLIKWSLSLLFSFPIGFYSKRKMFFGITAMYTAVLFGLIYMMNIPEWIYQSDYLTLGEKIYLIIDPIIVGIIFILGAFIGRLIGRDFWKDQDIRPVI